MLFAGVKTMNIEGENMTVTLIDAEDPLGLETYGYPQIFSTARNWVRLSLGWFLPENHEDEPACYMDFYFNRYGHFFILIDYWKEIQFHYEIEGLREDVLEHLRKVFA